ncbi:MAG: WD40 repeat domain-containing protein, partial [Prevotellaceae bacterium]|nr:WD40 repeat domain-containing protein [Prevotellaceae bacterium]
EEQREYAVGMQLRAEHSRNVADTLSYIALGRSLASLSSTQYLAGNKDASALLAYTAWKFTKDYKGNVNIPVIYKSLSQNSGSFTSSLIHKGGVSRICALNDKGDYVSVSRYGEITQWNYASGKWDKQLLSSNSACSYRDVCIDGEGVIYALSYNGLLQSVVGKQVSQPISLPESKGWTRVIPIGNKQILLSSASSLYLFDTVSRSVVASIQVPQEITSLGKKDDRIMVFGKNGGIWSIGKDAKLRAEEINLRGVVTAFTFDDEKNLSAIGLENGDIVVIDANGNSRGKLVGHSSRVTDLHFVGNFLFSSSYDRVVNIWDVNATNGEAVSIKDFTSWVYCMCSNDKKALFIGEQSGKVSRIVVSPSEMAKTIHSNLKRDFTDDEWEYYVGKNVPRIKLKN